MAIARQQSMPCHVLSRRTGTTADLAVRSGPYAVILVGGSVRPDTGLGLRRPLHSTALGKVLPAWPRPGEAAVSTLPPLRPFTGRTITEPALLDEELAMVRAAGYALNDGESAAGAWAAAVPVLDGAGQARFALAVRSTPAHLTDDRLDWPLGHARSCADALAVLLLPPDQRG